MTCPPLLSSTQNFKLTFWQMEMPERFLQFLWQHSPHNKDMIHKRFSHLGFRAADASPLDFWHDWKASWMHAAVTTTLGLFASNIRLCILRSTKRTSLSDYKLPPLFSLHSLVPLLINEVDFDVVSSMPPPVQLSNTSLSSFPTYNRFPLHVRFESRSVSKQRPHFVVWKLNC